MVRLNETVNQPWRYECPDCGAYDVVKIHSATRIRGKTYPWSNCGRRQIAADRAIDWGCNQCGERLETVYDTKHSELVSTQIAQNS